MQGTSHETFRLEALQRYAILDTESEASFDRISALTARLLEAPVCAISFIDEHRQWVKSCVGSDLRETPRAVAFCAHTIMGSTPLIVCDATLDARFASNPLVVGPPHVRFYAGAPILSSDGYALGALCVLDVVPRELTSLQVATLQDLASMVGDQLEARATVQAKRLLDKITGTSPDVIYLFDLERHRTVYRSCDSPLVPGYDCCGAHDFHAIHADDVPHVRAHLEDLRGMADGVRRQVSYRVDDDHQGHRWLLANETVFERDENGTPALLLGVASDITELKQAQAELARLAVTDEMTGLPNLRALHERLSVLWNESLRGRTFAVVMMDVDHFKAINDTHGHKTGDAVLKRIAQTLRDNVRGTDLVARYGGEEFCVLFVDVDQPTALVLAEKLRAAVAAISAPVPVTASFGVCANLRAGISPNTESVDSLIRAADDALYRAKRAGRNRVAPAYTGSSTGVVAVVLDAVIADPTREAQ